MNIDQLIDEMIEFGVPIDAALRIAPSLLPLFNEQGDLVESALCKAAPELATRIGLVQIH